MTGKDDNAGAKRGLKDKQDVQADAPDARSGAQENERLSPNVPTKEKARDPMDRGPGNY